MSGYSAPGFFEKKIERETTARVAAFLGGLGRGSENLGATGVRSDWMEQDGPAFGVPFFEKMYENTGYRYSNMQEMHRIDMYSVYAEAFLYIKLVGIPCFFS